MCRYNAVILLIIAIVFATIEETSPTTSKIQPLDVVIMVDQSLSLKAQTEKYEEILEKTIEKTFDVGPGKTMITLIRCGIYVYLGDLAMRKDNIKFGPSDDMNEIKQHIADIRKEADKANDEHDNELLQDCMEYVDETKDELENRPDVEDLLIYFGDTVHDKTPIDLVMPSIKKKFTVFYWKVPLPAKYKATHYNDIVKAIVSDSAAGVIELKLNPDDNDVEGMKKNIVKSTCSESAVVNEKCDFNGANCQISKTGGTGKKHCNESERDCYDDEKLKCCNTTFKVDMEKECDCNMMRNVSKEAKESGCPIPNCTVSDVKQHCGQSNELSTKNPNEETGQQSIDANSQMSTVTGTKRNGSNENPNKESGKQSGDEDQMPTIIGAVVGGIALLLLLVVIVVVIISRKKKKKKAKEGKKVKGGMGLKEAQAAEKARGVQVDLPESRYGGKSMKTAKDTSVKSKSKVSKKGAKGDDKPSTKTAKKSPATKSKSTISKKSKK